MSYECFSVEISEQVAHVVLNRPEKRNAMNPAFWRELPEIITELDSNAKARVIVISSTGPHFSAGLDLASFGSVAGSGENDEMRKRQRAIAVYNNILHTQHSFNVLEECRIPVLVAIQGGAIGGGVDLASACDIRYATEDAYLVIQEINIGMTADVGTFPRLVKLIPEGIVRELAYTGRRMPAREAKAAGLINEVFADHESMLAAVMTIARDIATKAPLAIYGSKRMINYARDHSTADGLDYISIWNASMLNVDEINEALTAKAEGRPGKFAELPAKRQ
jgi:enoyl-CoA hydratase